MVLRSRAELLFFQQLRPSKLETLDLGDAATGEYLIAFHWSKEFPLLREISMEGSMVQGFVVLRCLAGHPSLRYVNVVFCPLIEYTDALRLKDTLQQPDAIVQRMPMELYGMVQTNFTDDVIHRYWPDGTFQYERSEQSVGFVKRLRRSPDGVITLVLQFCDLDRNMSLMERRSLTPNVNLLPLGNNHHLRQVLVAQHLKTLRPPEGWPTMEHAALPLGCSIFYDANGVRQEAQNVESSIMVTRMQVWELDVPTPSDETLAIIRREMNIDTTI